jgi:VanZ family protein
MAVIFVMSTNLGGGANTSRILGPLLDFLFPGIAPETVAGIRLMIRKLAHFTEYFVLACLVSRAVFQSVAICQPWSWRCAGQVIAICVAYAASDEFHQTFVPGRVGSPMDVMIDSTGVIAGVGVLWIWRNRRCRRDPAG